MANRCMHRRGSLKSSARLPVAVGVGGGVAALEPYLVWAQSAPIVAGEEEPLVRHEAPDAGIGVELRHPRADTGWEELVVPGAVERVGEVDPPAVAADLHHLRAAGQRPVRLSRVGGAAHDPAQTCRADLARPRRVRDVELLELAGAP